MNYKDNIEREIYRHNESLAVRTLTMMLLQIDYCLLMGVEVRPDPDYLQTNPDTDCAMPYMVKIYVMQGENIAAASVRIDMTCLLDCDTSDDMMSIVNNICGGIQSVYKDNATGGIPSGETVN